MFGLARVRMHPFVQRRRGGHGVQQQDKTRQQRGDDRLAGWFELARYEPHNKRKLADVMVGASDFLIRSAGLRPGSLDAH